MQVHTPRIHITTTIAPAGRAWLQERRVSAAAALARGIRALQMQEAGRTDDIDTLRTNITGLQMQLQSAHSRIRELEVGQAELKEEVADVVEQAESS